MILEALHALYARLRPLILVLKLGNLIAHRVELLKLVLKSFLLSHEMLSFEAFFSMLSNFLLFFKILLPLQVRGFVTTWGSSSVA